MTQTEAAESAKTSGWVKLGFLFTGLYVALVAWTVGASDFVKFSAPMELHDLADALAGIFAPLAFLWLFVATMVQSQELSLQRRELQLTRREFEQNRQVAKEQAEEARNQAKFIGTQTEMMVWAENDKHLKVVLDGITTLVSQGSRQQIVIRTGQGESKLVRGPFDRAAFIGDVIESFSSSVEAVRNALEQFPGRKATFGQIVLLREIATLLAEVRSIMPGTSPKQKAELAQLGFERFEAATAYLLEVCKPRDE
ncbi:hypothetical protein NKH34_16045 [Mesorhizobium sp. M1148]|uniref:hypothetical protein n=1 Tax=unclassified Mesorhizobium TaxID=325217 RepID=UPI0003CE2AD0|nr:MULTISPECIES: hypothetical protein [unclassified Mesorhizobium]ESX71805.1 hypothetical protein X757_22400 [Mesorhizobium sp. LSHC414A00]WJI56139.1 hypothetical protein NLY33_23535 [Mesorhizobium sp. C432A]